MPARTPVAAALLLGGALVLVGPSGAGAASLSPGKICGPGFAVIDQLAIRFPGGGARVATAYLLYDSETGRNCSVTIKRVRRGTPDFMTAFVQRRGSGPKVDAGRFELYAGPVRVHAPGRCVRFGAKVQIGSRIAGGYSPYGHCGR